MQTKSEKKFAFDGLLTGLGYKDTAVLQVKPVNPKKNINTAITANTKEFLQNVVE
jgi:hypothetical protein